MKLSIETNEKLLYKLAELTHNLPYIRMYSTTSYDMNIGNLA